VLLLVASSPRKRDTFNSSSRGYFRPHHAIPLLPTLHHDPTLFSPHCFQVFSTLVKTEKNRKITVQLKIIKFKWEYYMVVKNHGTKTLSENTNTSVVVCVASSVNHFIRRV